MQEPEKELGPLFFSLGRSTELAPTVGDIEPFAMRLEQQDVSCDNMTRICHSPSVSSSDTDDHSNQSAFQPCLTHMSQRAVLRRRSGNPVGPTRFILPSRLLKIWHILRLNQYAVYAAQRETRCCCKTKRYLGVSLLLNVC